ncbi:MULTISPECIES: DUF192 domain-containing protein [unclassified Microcoleus]|uniref:DUF192 domain-containing protein n=1 Tax=unclassified Microcoleus TaxID=2642155 RepID=UPI002FD272E2
MNHLTNLLGIGGIGMFLLGCSPNLPTNTGKTSNQILPISGKAKIGNHLIKLEVAKTPEQQATGLMYRTSLPDDRGMLFELQSAQRVNFWMKDCKISLDMIFIRDGVIEAVKVSAPPCTANPCPTYGPNTAVDRVIELRGGRAGELGVKAGDRIKIELFQ